ncbi:MAG TPA: hemerythrin domain-containing protein [Ideonella sp.]|uniref:hemerythrin domain-containing protein n=1 Tax=Ideonella sp. TaxID=1929293 RepID=UPI002B64FDFC|nr:hemerythrin domain-containing protein [Ideonella sp.]HSI48573.1 hemerythrin domain-containing protein [Ideonella sp.]
MRTTASHTASPAKSRSPAAGKTTGRAPDAITLLRADHAEVKKLFKEYEKLAKAEAPAEDRSSMALSICEMLTVHAQIEEEIFYPAAREVLPEGDLVDEATVEHASAKDLIAQIEAGKPDDALYDAKVKVLGELIDHHVKEEQDEMFPKVKKAGMDTKAVGAQLAARKAELMASH